MLVDLPLHGHNFTWYKGDDNSMSRLDRFLMSEEWCLKWLFCLQVAHMRGLSGGLYKTQPLLQQKKTQTTKKGGILNKLNQRNNTMNDPNNKTNVKF